MIKIGDASGNVKATYWKKQGIEILGDTVKIFGTVNQRKEIKVLGLKKISEAENDCHKLSVELNKQIRMLKEEMKEGEQEEMKEDVREEMRQQMRIELEKEIREEVEKEKNEMKKQIMEKMKNEIKEEMRNEIKKKAKENVVATRKKDENVDDDKIENGLGKSKNIDENRNNRKDKKIDENKNLEG